MKIVMLLVISLGLLWFSEQFSPITIFEPQSIGWVLWISYAKDLIQPFAFYFFICIGERWLKTCQARVTGVYNPYAFGIRSGFLLPSSNWSLRGLIRPT